MSVDLIARGIAARARAAAPRVPIAVGIVGQSNERGQVDPGEAIGGVASATAHPQAYRSLRNPGLAYPIGPAVTKQGGMWFRFYDDLWDWGYDARIVNGAVGSLSFVSDAAGVPATRANATGYRRQRPSAGAGDRGFRGDLMVASGKLFLCTAGRDAYAVNKGLDIPFDTASFGDLDYTRIVGTQATAASDPGTFAAASVGDAIVDGTVTWTCVFATTTWRGYSYTAGLPLTENRFGFDPYGILHGVHEEMQRIRDARHKIVILQNAQSDRAYSSSAYSAALQQAGTYFLNRGYTVLIGLSVFDPPEATTTQYDTLTTGVGSAITALQANAGAPGNGWTAAQVKAGANLYTLMGSTGAMAAGGAYFAKDAGQDNVHLNAAGAIAAGAHEANAIKAWLPMAVR